MPDMPLALYVLIFGAVILVAEAAIMIARGHVWSAQSVRVLTMTLIIVAAVFLAVSDSQRVGAAYALLGVIAGYLAGSYESRKSERD
jgi:hypothetical protein